MSFSLPVDNTTESTYPLLAVCFSGHHHPIVRLVSDNVRAAEATVLSIFGLHEQGAVVVGESSQRAVGFPAWPIMIDPANTHHALNLVAELEKARRSPSARRVKRRFDALVNSLAVSAPHFIPTLLEEVARIFVGTGNLPVARQYFGAARDTEQTYSLAIDEARHRAVCTEFAALGAISGRSLSAEAKRSGDFEYTLRLVWLQACAGVAPYRDAPRDLRRLGSRLGLSPDEVDAALVDALAGTPGWHKVSVGMVAELRSAIVAHPSAAGIVWALKPQRLSPLAFLHTLYKTGVLELMHADRQRHAEWLLNFFEEFSARNLMDYSAVLEAEIMYVGQLLRGRKVKARLWYLPLNVIDALCECGVEWSYEGLGSEDFSLDFSLWLHEEYAKNRRPLLHLAQHPELSRQAATDIDRYDVYHHLDVFLRHQGARELLARKIEALAATPPGPVNKREIKDSWDFLATPAMLREFGEPLRQMFEVDAAAMLGASIRCGVWSELTWPAFEEAAVRVQERAEAEVYKALPSYPAVAVLSGTHVEVVEGDHVVAAGELPTTHYAVTALYGVGDDWAALHLDGDDWKISWLGSRETRVVANTQCEGSYVSLACGDGTRLTARGMLDANSRRWPTEPGNVLATADPHAPVFAYEYFNYQLSQWNGTSLSQWRGRETDFLHQLPLPVEWSSLPKTAEVNIAHSMIVPQCPSTRNSLLGAVDGTHFCVAFDRGFMYYLASPLGVFSYDNSLFAAIHRPGGGVWALGEGVLVDGKTGVALSRAKEHTPIHNLPRPGFHQLRSRDEHCSTLMRAYTNNQARQVLDAKDPRAVLAHQLGTKHGPVLAELTDLVAEVKHLADALHKLSRQLSREETSPLECALTPEALDLVCKYTNLYKNQADDVTAATEAIAVFVADSTFDGNVPPLPEWTCFIGNERLLMAAVGRPLLRTQPGFSELVQFLRAATNAGVFGSQQYYRGRFELGPLPADEQHADTPTVIDGCLVLDSTAQATDTGIILSVHALIPRGKTTVEGAAVTSLEFFPMPATNIIALLDVIQTKQHPRVPRSRYAAIARNTYLLQPSAQLLFGGAATKLHPTQRAVAQLQCDHLQAIHPEPHPEIDAAFSVQSLLLAAGMNPDNPLDYIHNGPDIARVLRAWERYFGTDYAQVDVHLYAKALHSNNIPPYTDVLKDLLWPPGKLANVDSIWMGDLTAYISAYLHLAQELSPNDPLRQFLAQKFQTLRQVATSHPRTANLGSIPFGSSYRDRGFPKSNSTPEDHAIRLLTEGHLDAYIADLHTASQVNGCPFDPAVTAPDTVAAVAQYHHITYNAARYYLQLLALPYPRDVDTQRWNNWEAQTLNEAGEELLDRELVIEATRPNTGRRWFLPGGWLAGTKQDKPMESWKAPLYQLWADSKVRPIIRGCPLLAPAAQVFADAWQRCLNGDAPGYISLVTKKYRIPRPRQ